MCVFFLFYFIRVHTHLTNIKTSLVPLTTAYKHMANKKWMLFFGKWMVRKECNISCTLKSRKTISQEITTAFLILGFIHRLYILSNVVPCLSLHTLPHVYFSSSIAFSYLTELLFAYYYCFFLVLCFYFYSFFSCYTYRRYYMYLLYNIQYTLQTRNQISIPLDTAQFIYKTVAAMSGKIK